MKNKSFLEKYNDLVLEVSTIDDWGDILPCKAIPEHRLERYILNTHDQIKQKLPYLRDPHPSASEDGTLYLRYLKPNIIFDIEIDANDQISWTSLVGSHTSRTGVVKNIDELIEIMSFMSLK